MKKIRLDKLLFEKRLVESREKAKALILAGNVLIDDITIDKAGASVASNVSIEILKKMPYVSRGGVKLEGAIKDFNIDVKDKTAMDAGASTGGFTDCLLQYGAKKVYAVDVGYGQFDWRLRNDKRVVLLEKTNIRYLKDRLKGRGTRDKDKDIKDLMENNIDIVTIDVSFISLLKVLPAVIEFLKENGEIVALIKPQFEAGKKDVGKGGVVRDEKKQLEVVETIKSESEKMGLEVIGTTKSPLRGPKGNVEYFIYLKKL